VGGGWAPDPNYKGKGLQLQFTVEDEGAFTMPWSATMTYRRPVTTEWPEIVCAENTREYYAGNDTEVPRAKKPDFWAGMHPCTRKWPFGVNRVDSQ
jgi:hypothetical protein